MVDEGSEAPHIRPVVRGPGPSRGVVLGKRDSEEAPTPKAPKLDLASVAPHLLAAFGTGIGVLGFVVFFGAAILWIRYDRAGLPADEAVAVVPKPTLLTTGAEFLAPALGVALISVLVLLVIDVFLRSRRSVRTVKALERRQEETRKAATSRHQKHRAAEQRTSDARDRRSELGAEASWFERARARVQLIVAMAREWLAERVAERAGRIAGSAGTAVDRAKVKESDPAKNIIDVIDRDDYKAEFLVTAFYISAVLLVELAVIGGSALDIGLGRTVLLIVVVAALALVNWLAFEHSGGLGWRRVIFLFGLAIVSIGVIWLVARKQGSWNELRPTAILIGVALLTVGVSWLVYRETKRAVVLGVATFLSVGIFAGAATFHRTADTLKLEPAAVLRKSQGPVVGVYVAQTSTRFYLGVGVTDHQNRNHARLVAIPSDNVADFAVKDLAPVSWARVHADTLGLRLCRARAIERRVNANKAVQGAACTDKQKLRLIADRRLMQAKIEHQNRAG